MRRPPTCSSTLGFTDFQIRRQSPQAAERGARRTPACRRNCTATALVALDKVDKIGVDGVSRRNSREQGPERRRSPHDVARSAAAAPPRPIATRGWRAIATCSTTTARRRIDDLRQIFALCAATPGRRRTCALDPQPGARPVVLHGADLRDRVPDLAGSLGGGGRYDNLIGMFSGESVPASGILARPRAHPRRDGRARACSRPTSVADARGRDGRAVVREPHRRVSGVRDASCAPPDCASSSIRSADKIGKQFKYASRARHSIRRRHWCRRTGKRHRHGQEYEDRRAAACRGRTCAIVRDRVNPSSNRRRTVARAMAEQLGSSGTYSHLRRASPRRRRQEGRAARMGAPRARPRRRCCSSTSAIATA